MTHAPIDAAPFDPERFHALLTTESFGRSLTFEPTVGSTMDLARDAAAHGAPEGALVCADEQTAGRGRLGRTWITPPATNIAATLILRPPPAVLRDIAMIAPLAIAHAIEDVAGIRPGLKWPNDVQLNGKKVAGILIEVPQPPAPPESLPSPPVGERLGVRAELGVVLVGTGINVNFDPRTIDEIRDVATSIIVETGAPADRESLLAAYAGHFERLYTAALAGTSPRDEWRERLVTIGREVRASWQGGSAEGLAEDVDADGALLVRTAPGALVRVEAGDVTLRV
jgi:BirA family biotin operon repressor/biotin-[acetyl-CoA-carboxylase] ligase